MENPELNVPAVVVGVDVNGLGVVRSLARMKVPVLALDEDTCKPTMKTRYGKKLRVSALDKKQLIDDLREISGSFENLPVLFLTEEKSVELISQYREELSGYYRFTLPEKAILSSLMHKESFHKYAEKLNARVPGTVRITDMEEIDLVKELEFPCVLKPGRKDVLYGQKFKKAYKVNNIEEVRALYKKIHGTLNDIVVQEWVEGNDSDIYFCLQYIGSNGNLVASFCGRKIRSWPPYVGGTASCTAANHERDKLETITFDFFRSAGCVGMCSMEYKRDSRNGQFVMIEPTVGRTDYQEEVATLNGVNIPFAAYCHELALTQPSFNVLDTPAIWRDGLMDRWSAQLQNDKNSFNTRGIRVYDTYWRIDDPAPWIHYTTKRLARKLKNTLGLFNKN